MTLIRQVRIRVCVYASRELRALLLTSQHDFARHIYDVDLSVYTHTHSTTQPYKMSYYPPPQGYPPAQGQGMQGTINSVMHKVGASYAPSTHTHHKFDSPPAQRDFCPATTSRATLSKAHTLSRVIPRPPVTHSQATERCRRLCMAVIPRSKDTVNRCPTVAVTGMAARRDTSRARDTKDTRSEAPSAPRVAVN